MNNQKERSPWLWVPSLYYIEGLPLILITFVADILYKRMGISNTDITFYTSWIYLAWVVKPLWSPFVDILKTKRLWIIITQLVIGIGFVCFSFAISLPNFFVITIVVLWLLAFCSATHDIAADGYYMLALSKHNQTFFVGIRSTFYRLAILTGQGFLIIFAGYLENTLANIPLAWSITFISTGIIIILFVIYHKFILPYPVSDKTAIEKTSSNLSSEFFQTFKLFFKKDKIIVVISFLLLYRFGEAQLSKIAKLFLLDPNSIGGLGLSTSEVGIAYGTVGVIMLLAGGILGGIVASIDGLKFWIWWMALALKLPDIVYVYFAYYLPDNFLLINICIGLEQFGYGFGFTAYVLYMIYIAEGKFKTAHYAIATGFMAMGMMIPGMFSGWLQELIGYQYFFIWVLIATIPGLILLKYIPLDPDFGKRN